MLLRVPLLPAGSLSLDDVVRDLLFEPASLDEWVVPGRRWEDPPPELVAASEPAGRRRVTCRADAARCSAAAGSLSGTQRLHQAPAVRHLLWFRECGLQKTKVGGGGGFVPAELVPQFRTNANMGN